MIQVDGNMLIVLVVAVLGSLLMFLLHLPFGKNEAKAVVVIYGIYAFVVCAVYAAWRFLFEL